jgi:hypothetical protein
MTASSDRLDRIEQILEVLARETLANTRAIADNTRAIADNAQAIAAMTESIQQLKRTVDYLLSQDGGT